MQKKVIIVGGFHEVIELCEFESIQIVGIIDNYKIGSYKGYEILGTDADAAKLYNSFRNFPLVITPDFPQRRCLLAEIYNQAGFTFTSLISSNSSISKSAKMGEGILIKPMVNISSEVKIGAFVSLNTMANIMHDSIIDSFTTIAPNAVVLGNIRIGKHCYIGSNSTILPNITIGNNVVIGAGAVVTKDVPDNKIMIGNPARELVKKI
jgi:sugar O-acyltransferase (sialic acid O-acetyltransferase NeuD family)